LGQGEYVVFVERRASVTEHSEVYRGLAPIIQAVHFDEKTRLLFAKQAHDPSEDLYLSACGIALQKIATELASHGRCCRKMRICRHQRLKNYLKTEPPPILVKFKIERVM